MIQEIDVQALQKMTILAKLAALFHSMIRRPKLRSLEVFPDGGISFGGGARIEVKSRYLDKPKFRYERVEGMEIRRDGKGYVRKYRVIDRENDRYIEKVTDYVTGEVLRDIEERLMEHWGRGSAREPRGDKKS